MKISYEEVEHVGRLARLALSEEERDKMRAQLDAILSHVIPMTNVFREDKVRPSLSQEQALANAPDRQEALFRVPRILEE